jgi:hypothetical protein
MLTIFDGPMIFDSSDRFFDIICQRGDVIRHSLFDLLFAHLFKGAFAGHFNYRLDILPMHHVCQPICDGQQVIVALIDSTIRLFYLFKIITLPVPEGYPNMSCRRTPKFLWTDDADCP